jgi:hypothetical protein
VIDALQIVPRPSFDPERLFGLILPRDGYRAGAISWKPRDSADTILYNRLFETDAELAKWAARRADSGNVWHATATFKNACDFAGDGFKGRRDESNVHSRQCFHGDLDCGETKPYLASIMPRRRWGWQPLNLDCHHL